MQFYLVWFFSGISSYIGGIYIAHKKSKEIGLTTIVAALVNLIINISLINFIEIYAASISTMVSYLFLALYRMKDVQKIQKINYNFKQIIIGLILLFTMCIINFANNNFFNIINVILSVTVFLVFNKNIAIKLTVIFRDKLVSK
ncbi:MAG: polysaccharide biosynthesis C-terminal domain-containing protein [Romboutsia timonensis]